MGDWNDDGSDDVGSFRAVSGNGAFILDSNGNGNWDGNDAFFYYGSEGNQPVAGDWNWKGTDEIGIFVVNGAAGQFTQDVNGNGYPDGDDREHLFFITTDTPLVGDWNRDGHDEIGVFRVNGADGQFILDSNGNGTLDLDDLVYNYGLATDTPVTGDWNGDGRDEIGVFRPSGANGQFIVDANGDGSLDQNDPVYNYGLATDAPIIGDWDADGQDDIGVFRGISGNGVFILDSNGNGYWDGSDAADYFGYDVDTPIIGDWNGDGRDNIGVVQAIGGYGIFILDSNGSDSWDGEDVGYCYGLATDTPLVGDWDGAGVAFTDPDLSAAVHHALAVPVGKQLTPDDMLQLTSVTVDSSSLNSLFGQQYARNLES